jgi:hypothetical protein
MSLFKRRDSCQGLSGLNAHWTLDAIAIAIAIAKALAAVRAAAEEDHNHFSERTVVHRPGPT